MSTRWKIEQLSDWTLNTSKLFTVGVAGWGFKKYKKMNRIKTQEKYEERVKKDKLLSYLINNKHSFILTGGSVIDIADGRKPKDYDFLDISSYFLEECELLNYTSTSTTYKFQDNIIQLLNTEPETFGFSISRNQITVSPERYRGNMLEIDIPRLLKEVEFTSRILRPNFNNPINALMRIPHWQKKGYRVIDESYLSLLNCAFNINNKKINS